MITAIEIENFKGIGERVRLELRPITLLFGMNSAGKSSLLHALIYAREVFERHNLDADRTLACGDSLDIGGFRSFVHNQDLRRSIRLRFDLDLAGIDLPDVDRLRRQRDDETYGGIFLELLPDTSRRVTSASVSVSIAWSPSRQAPFVENYAVDLNGEPFARLETNEKGSSVVITDVQFRHPVFLAEESDDSPSILESLYEQAEPVLLRVGAGGTIGVQYQTDALPSFDQTLTLALRGADQVEKNDPHEQKRDRTARLGRLFHQLLVGPGSLLRNQLRQFRYIGPLREVPARNYRPPRRPDPSRWACGLAGWDLLCARPTLVEKVSRLLADTDRLNLGYELELVEFREFDARDPVLTAVQANRLEDIEDIAAWFRKSSVRQRLLFRPLETPEVYLEPVDLGVGIGQMIPAIAAALDDQPVGSAIVPVQLVAIEHPELNLHPRMQAEIADVFLEGALSETTKGRVFFIETHSEHLTLRLFRRIRESTRSQGRFGITVKPTDVGVWHIDRSTSVVTVKRILVDVEGEFVQPWPEDDTLFEQAFRERYT